MVLRSDSTLSQESFEEVDVKSLSFVFHGYKVPVNVLDTVTPVEARMALDCAQFKAWVARCERSYDNKKFKMHSVELQSVDPFGNRGVGFVKINCHCTLLEGDVESDHRLKGICFLKGDSVAILVALHCDDGTIHSLLVEQPRVPLGQISAFELPAGMIDDEDDECAGTAVKELEEECGIRVDPKQLVDLTELASQVADQPQLLPGIAPSGGACDETVRFFYLEKQVTVEQLNGLRNKLIGATEFGAFLTLRVVPWDQVWKISRDSKTMVAMFLLEQLRKEGKVPAPGGIATPLERTEGAKAATEPTKPVAPAEEPVVTTAAGLKIPQLAFSLNLVPPTKQGEEIIRNAIRAGYRHFDTSQFSRNEKSLGKVLRESGIPREEFFICSKVWNEAQKCGRFAVRKSVEKSIKDLNFGDYFDLFMLHWPVPRYYTDSYRELEELQKKGVVKSIGFRNFSEREHKMLLKHNIEITPAVCQFDASPAMCPHGKVKYFKEHNILVAATHAMNRGKSFDEPVIMETAHKYGVTPAQVMIRWAMQKGFIVVSRSQKYENMTENRSVCHFEMTADEVKDLDDLTDEADLKKKSAREFMRKTSM